MSDVISTGTSAAANTARVVIFDNATGLELASFIANDCTVVITGASQPRAVDPWEQLRDRLTQTMRDIVADFVVTLRSLEPPPWVALAPTWLGRSNRRPSSRLAVRTWRPRARACAKSARRWKRRRYVHALRRRLSAGSLES
jgi:hypothetical protein